MRYRVPLSLKIILGAMFVVWFAMSWRILVQWYRPVQFLQITPLFAVPLALLWFNNTGYRVGYDDDAIYNRMMGLTWRLRWPAWRRIAWGDIDRLEGRSQDGTPSFTPLLPWQYLAVVPTGEPDEKREVWIYAESLSEADLAEILSVLVTRRPDLAPSEIVEPLRERGFLPAAA